MGSFPPRAGVRAEPGFRQRWELNTLVQTVFTMAVLVKAVLVKAVLVKAVLVKAVLVKAVLVKAVLVKESRVSLRLLRIIFPLTLLVSLSGCMSLLEAAVKETPSTGVARKDPGISNASVYSTWLRALDAERLGNFDEAEKLVRRALDLDPRSATLTVHLAKLRAQQRQFDEAIALTQKAIELQPVHVDAHVQLATLYQLTNRSADAEQAWKKAISLAPTDERAYIELANLYRTREQAREGLMLLEDFQKRGGEPGVQMLMLMAALHKDAGDLETARKEVLEVLDMYPDFPQAQRALLDLYFADGGLKDVAARLEKLFQERPWQTWIRDTLVQLYARLGDVDGINRQLLDATESDQEEGERLRLEAVEELASRREFPKAVQVLEPMLKSNTDNERAWFFAGFLYARQKDHPKALEFYAKIPKGSLLYPRALEQRARVLQAALRSDEAVALLVAYLQEEPDADEIRSTLVTIYANTRNFQRALDGVDELLKRNPSDVDALSQRAFILHDMKRDEEALGVLRKAILEQPGQVRLYEAQSLILGELGRAKEAVEVLKQALLVQPESESLRFALGTYYDQLKMHDEAIAEMFKILESNRHSSEAMNFIGYTWAELGIRLPEAETFIKRALELDPNNGYITDSLGWVYFKAGRYADAVKLLERAVELTTQEPVIVDHLGDAYMKVGDKEKAFRMYERATREAEGDDKLEPELEASVRRKYESLGKELGRPVEPRKVEE